MSNTQFFSGRPCVACAHSHKRYPLSCDYARIFPDVIDREDYHTIFTVFEVRNVASFLQRVPEDRLFEALSSYLLEATARIENPAGGCTALLASFEQKVEELQARVTALEARLGGGSSCVNPLCSFTPPGGSSRFLSLAKNNVPNVIPTVVDLSELIPGSFLRLLMSEEDRLRDGFTWATFATIVVFMIKNENTFITPKINYQMTTWRIQGGTPGAKIRSEILAKINVITDASRESFKDYKISERMRRFGVETLARRNHRLFWEDTDQAYDLKNLLPLSLHFLVKKLFETSAAIFCVFQRRFMKIGLGVALRDLRRTIMCISTSLKSVNIRFESPPKILLPTHISIVFQHYSVKKLFETSAAIFCVFQRRANMGEVNLLLVFDAVMREANLSHWDYVMSTCDCARDRIVRDAKVDALFDTGFMRVETTEDIQALQRLVRTKRWFGVGAFIDADDFRSTTT
ncbi:hypothetical protein LguiA_002598 [Lonicera macranthoides]